MNTAEISYSNNNVRRWIVGAGTGFGGLHTSFGWHYAPHSRQAMTLQENGNLSVSGRVSDNRGQDLTTMQTNGQARSNVSFSFNNGTLTITTT